MCVDLSLGFLFCSIDLYFCLCASTILSWRLWLCSRAWSQAGWFLHFHSSFSRLLWLFEVFCISIQIVKLFVLALWKKYRWQLDRDCIESIDCFGKYTYFQYIDSSDPWTWYISPFIHIILNFFHQFFIVFYIYVFCFFS